MAIDWANIKEKIYNNVSKTLKAGTPSFTEEEIKNAIELFKKFILFKSGYAALDGLSKSLLPALQDAFIDKKGEVGSLTIISTNIEAFVRKLLVSVVGEPYSNVESISGLAPLLKRTNINTALSAQASAKDHPQLDATKLSLYIHETEYLYSICQTYITRNSVHVSADMDDAEVFNELKHVLIVYIYLILKYSSQINSLPNISNLSEDSKSASQDNEQKMLYDFISFGNTSTEIKTQFVNAYILHSLRDKEFIEIKNVIDDSNKYFENKFSNEFYIRKIDNLIQKNKLKYFDTGKQKISLTKQESENLKKLQINFQENRDLFFLYFDELLNKYQIIDKHDDLLCRMEAFFEKNFNIDLDEIYCDIDDGKDQNDILTPLFDYLKEITSKEEDAQILLKDILVLCENNDFLLRISASKVFSKISNPDQFHNYLRQQKRTIFLDSQIILYALCCNYISKDGYDNIFYKITSNLLEYAENNHNIELKFGNQYISEIIYQLKLALFLIPFADNEETADASLSSNIYYQYYYHLKSNNLLEDDINSFEDFMSNWLFLEEKDAYDSDYEKIASTAVIDILKQDLDIDVIKLPYYEDVEDVCNLLEEVIKENLLSIKSHHVLKNDAIMVSHLFNNQAHDSEPFFLTWDKSFTPFRKKFKDKYKKKDILSWHLFTPSKFLNHMDLINFKIDPTSITNDFLSVMDGSLHNMTRTIVDSINKFLNIENISKTQRHKYIKIAKGFFSESEFSYQIESPIDLRTKISDSFAEILDNINKYLYTESELGIEKYRKMLLNESFFTKTLELIQSQIKIKIAENIVHESQLFENIESNIKEFEKEETKKIENK